MPADTGSACGYYVEALHVASNLEGGEVGCSMGQIGCGVVIIQLHSKVRLEGRQDENPCVSAEVMSAGVVALIDRRNPIVSSAGLLTTNHNVHYNSLTFLSIALFLQYESTLRV